MEFKNTTITHCAMKNVHFYEEDLLLHLFLKITEERALWRKDPNRTLSDG